MARMDWEVKGVLGDAPSTKEIFYRTVVDRVAVVEEDANEYVRVKDADGNDIKNDDGGYKYEEKPIRRISEHSTTIFRNEQKEEPKFLKI